MISASLPPILEVISLRKQFGDHVVLASVYLVVPRGSIVSVLGSFYPVVVIALAVYEFQHMGPIWAHAVLGLVMGGALGNAFDRLLYGSVTDFLAVHW